MNDNSEAYAIRFDFQIRMRSVSGKLRRFSEIFVSGFASSIKCPLPLSALISERKMLFVLLVPNSLIEGETASRNSIASKKNPTRTKPSITTSGEEEKQTAGAFT